MTVQVDTTETGGEPGKIQVIDDETEKIIVEMTTTRKTKVGVYCRSDKRDKDKK